MWMMYLVSNSFTNELSDHPDRHSKLEDVYANRMLYHYAPTSSHHGYIFAPNYVTYCSPWRKGGGVMGVNIM